MSVIAVVHVEWDISKVRKVPRILIGLVRLSHLIRDDIRARFNKDSGTRNDPLGFQRVVVIVEPQVPQNERVTACQPGFVSGKKRGTCVGTKEIKDGTYCS